MVLAPRHAWFAISIERMIAMRALSDDDARAAVCARFHGGKLERQPWNKKPSRAGQRESSRTRRVPSSTVTRLAHAVSNPIVRVALTDHVWMSRLQYPHRFSLEREPAKACFLGR